MNRKWILAPTAILSLILFASLAAAQPDPFVLGRVNADGYAFAGGGELPGQGKVTLWQWPGGRLYTRALHNMPAVIQNGCVISGYAKWIYTPYTPPPSAQPVVVVVNNNNQQAVAAKPYVKPDWREQQQQYAFEMDRRRAAAEKEAQDQKNYLEGLEALGLNRRAQYPAGYPGSPGYVATGHYYNSITPVNASTQYGVGQYDSRVYGDGGLATLMQMWGQLANGAQRNSDKTTAAIGDAARAAADHAARMQERDLRYALAVKMLEALSGPPTTVTSGFKFTVEPGGTFRKTPDETVTPDQKKTVREQWQTHAANACAGCHYGDKIKGGFDVGAYLTMSPAQKERVFRVLTSDDPKVWMPRKADAAGNMAPGTKLTKEESQLWIVVD